MARLVRLLSRGRQAPSLDGAIASGQGWRDGQPLQAVADAAAMSDKDWARVSLQVNAPSRNDSAGAEVQAQAERRGSG